MVDGLSSATYTSLLVSDQFDDDQKPDKFSLRALADQYHQTVNALYPCDWFINAL